MKKELKPDSALQQNTDPSAGRRRVLKGMLGTGMLAASADFMLPALAQGEQVVPFTDVPDTFSAPPVRPNATHWLDTREINTFFTDNDDYYIVQHYGQPEIDNDSWRLRITGMVDNELEFSLSDLMARSPVEQVVGFECGGNSPGLQNGLIGNGLWRGISLADLLREAGVQVGAKEIVFFGSEVLENRETEVEKAFARSMSIEDAMRPSNMLAYEMNGEPLPYYHGKPLRLLVPGWYGVANVKWLDQIHVQDTRYMGRFMGRDYVTLKKEVVGGEERWVENSVTAINLKSFVYRVTRMGDSANIQGFVLNDGTPLESVEISIDNGPWQRATLDPRNTQYSWKLFTFEWDNPSSGEHTIVSRATDVTGHVQPTQDEFPEKVSRWENFAQQPRSVRV